MQNCTVWVTRFELREHLIEKLNSEDKAEVREAIEALKEFQEPEVVKAIVEAVINRRSKAVLEAAKEALISFTNVKECVCKEVLKLFNYPEPKLRQAAIEIISSHGDICLPIVKDKLINSKDYNMRKFALDILANIKTEKALRELAPLLRDENSNVRMSALEYLRNFSPYKEQIADLILDVLPEIKDMYGLTTLASTIVYGNIKDSRLVEPLKEKLKHTEDPLSRYWIYKILIFLGDSSIISEAIENARKIGMEQDVEKDIKIFGGE